MKDVGATDELSLRVSVATLVRVVAADADHANPFLALERTATFFKQEGRARVKAQPFGGAICINDPGGVTSTLRGFSF